MIPETTIARVRESVNLAELVREHVPTLKKRGRNYLARCPFHQEKTPSFNVNPEMGVFKCFGCGAGGDAFKFLMLMEGLSYPDSIRKIAGRVGIPVEEEQQSEAVTAQVKEKQALYGLLEDAARFYHRYLLESAEASVARDYLAKRGLDASSLTKFAIGFAPASGTALRDAAVRKGCSIEVLEKAGLVRQKAAPEGASLAQRGRDGGRTHDAFWNRIMFPIWDVQGRIIAFGGRAMGDAMPKYINSSETPVYSKSRHLYGLFQGIATLRKERHVIILEGYMDVVTCHQFGLESTSATLGTALTEDHVRILRRYADKVTLLFDPDAAGAQASLRGGELLIADGFAVDVVTLEEGVDIDEVLVQSGRTAIDQQLAQATPFMDYFIAQAQSRHPGMAPETKLQIAKDVLPVIHKIKDPLLQDEYLGRLANALRVEKAILGQQMKRLKLSHDDRQAPKTALPSGPAVSSLLSIEEELIYLAVHHPSEMMTRALLEVTWIDPRCAEAWQFMRTKLEAGTLQLVEVLPLVSESTRDWLSPLAIQERRYDKPQEVLGRLLSDWQRKKEEHECAALKLEITAMIDGKIPHDPLKQKVYHDLLKRLKGSKPELNNFQEAPRHG